ncbi:Phosphohistidine phosphatase SixA [compost metagenome]
MLVSPYLRAEQTLATVREALTLPASEEVLPELTPGGDASQVGSYLQVLAQQGISSVLIVSHLPLVGYLVAELCPGECPPMFATSAIANVDLAADGSYGKFEWQVSPSQVMAKV